MIYIISFVNRKVVKKALEERKNFILNEFD